MLIQWWELLVFTATGMVGVLLAVLLGGWLVFKAKTITMPTPFMQIPKRENGGGSYLPNELRDSIDQPDDELSPAAARLRGQKGVPPKSGKESVMAFVKGGKQ